MAAQHRHTRAGAAPEARREREVDVAAHTHSHAPSGSDAAARQALTRALILTGAFALVEAAGGWLAGSLALLSDAGHMFTDTAALGLALFAQWIARRPPSRRASYGYARAEVLAAFIVGNASGDEVVAAAKRELASFKVPRRVEVVDELPRTGTGKVVKRELIQALE